MFRCRGRSRVSGLGLGAQGSSLGSRVSGLEGGRALRPDPIAETWREVSGALPAEDACEPIEGRAQRALGALCDPSAGAHRPFCPHSPALTVCFVPPRYCIGISTWDRRRFSRQSQLRFRGCVASHPHNLALCLQEVLVPGSSAPWPCSLPASRTRRAVPPGSSQTAQPVEAARGGGFTAPPSPSRLLPASLRSPQSHNHRLLVDDGSIGAPNGSQSHHHFGRWISLCDWGILCTPIAHKHSFTVRCAFGCSTEPARPSQRVPRAEGAATRRAKRGCPAAKCGHSRAA